MRLILSRTTTFSLVLVTAVHPQWLSRGNGVSVEAFAPAQNGQTLRLGHQRYYPSKRQASTLLTVSLAPLNDDSCNDYWIDKDELKSPIVISLGGEKDKIVDAFGMWCAIVSFLTMPFWMLAMTCVDMYAKMNPEWDPHRSLFDKTGKLWSKLWLYMTHSYPTITGELYCEGPCLYVANHASWLDIPVLCTCLEPCFKFIAKGELSKLPGIGQQLTGGHHILIDREDRRSQLKTFKEAIGWLKKGVPLMAFPEGTRSKTGRLMDFKGGIFSMAIKTGVPIVPLTLSHTHAIFPPYALLPVQPGSNKLRVHIHEPISSEGRAEEDLSKLVRDAFLSALPQCQRPPVQETSISEPISGQNLAIS